MSLVLSVSKIQRAWRARCAHLAENLFHRNGISDPATIERLNRLRAELCILGRDEVRHPRRTPATTAPPPPLHPRHQSTPATNPPPPPLHQQPNPETLTLALTLTLTVALTRCA